MKKRWASWEHAKLFAMVREGKTCQEMGRVLRRSQCAVRSRARSYRMWSRDIVMPAVVIMPAVRIAVVDVPQWYELGWRFDGFIPGGLCRMEWRSEQPERRPATIKMLVAA